MTNNFKITFQTNKWIYRSVLTLFLSIYSYYMAPISTKESRSRKPITQKFHIRVWQMVHWGIIKSELCFSDCDHTECIFCLTQKLTSLRSWLYWTIWMGTFLKGIYMYLLLWEQMLSHKSSFLWNGEQIFLVLE